MYLPEAFAEHRPETLHALIRANPLGAVVIRTDDGFDANHLPFELDIGAEGKAVLRGHVARSNAFATLTAGTDALVIFEGPSAYISPNWYPSKQTTHEVVPTYNYAVVHVHGRMRAIDDPRWVRGLVARLTHRMEASQPKPWKMGDAPPAYLDELITKIVGIEIPVDRMIGKWKMSQNKTHADRTGVADGLAASGSATAAEVARLVRP
ncbi:FMN-binding negative transcriptional regulator [Pararobbsia silviterrae]|uniref:FMN-binding negative transcriptional regulator n=1 Tax=Pararobbsia silviterrae TaxID=1792498 RepID=A0A494XQC2_9BURK|nr:FMN-binding negative transcriptional regulator [Pararobbsia silviterrae]RKP50304.1 FMN-binding negative transcriptional regulator [Pararobbsia silviterrae]